MQASTSGDTGDSADHQDVEGACSKPSQKRQKGRSKVWERVAWFTRKSKSRDGPESRAVENDPSSGSSEQMELDFSPSTSSSDPSSGFLLPWLESSSSSDGEVFETEEGYLVKRSSLFPNSEVVEQNCLRPSMARALFHQMEIATNCGQKATKYAWQKKKRAHCLPKSDSLYADGSSMMYNEESLARAISVPTEIMKKSECHCRACCSCTPSQRLMGACPAHARLSTSTTSLDTGLSRTVTCQTFADDSEDSKPDWLSTIGPANPNNCCDEGMHDCPQSSRKNSGDEQDVPSGPIIANHFKSTSLPAYYRNPSHKNRCRKCHQPFKSHLPVCDRSGLDKPWTTDFCECSSSTNGRDTKTVIPIPPVEEVPKYQEDKVKAADYKLRRDIMCQWFAEFNDEQKNLMLKDLFSHFELPQMHLLSLEMGPKLHDGCPPNCQDLLSWLPQSIVLFILSFLDPVNLCITSCVCKKWHQMANESSLWRRFCCQPKWRLSRSGEQKQMLHHMMPNGNIHWKRVFAERYRLRKNWLSGMCNVRTFEGHTQGISCVQFDDTRIVSGSSDKTIKVWNIRTNTPWSVQTLVGHSGTVRCLHLEGNRLVSGSTDKSIKVWDLSTQQSWSSIACKVTMIGHTDTVRCLQVDDDKVISGSYDKTLKVWGVKSGDCRMTLRGHDAAVLCVQFDDTKIISGSCDKFIKVWNFSGHCIMTLQGHHDAVTCLQFGDTRIVSGSLDCNLKFWDVHTGQCTNTIDWRDSEGHTGVVRCLQADSWRVVSASDDRTLKVWSLETGERLVTLRNHTDGVTCLQFNDSVIVSGSYDKTVKLWDFRCC